MFEKWRVFFKSFGIWFTIIEYDVGIRLGIIKWNDNAQRQLDQAFFSNNISQEDESFAESKRICWQCECEE